MNIFLRYFPAKKTWLNLPMRWKVLVPIFGMAIIISLAALGAFSISTSRLATETSLTTAHIVTDRIRADREPFLDAGYDVTTANATTEISGRITTLQQDSAEVADVIGSIGTIVQRINELQNAIAVAVEEQTSTTAEIDGSARQAADGSREIASRLSDISVSASATLTNAGSTEEASQRLAGLSAELRKMVERFRFKPNPS